MKKLLICIALAVAFVGAGGGIVLAADANSEVCGGIATIAATNCSNSGGVSEINRVMKLAIDIFSIVLGIIAVFAIMVAGVIIGTAGGDSAKVGKAREILIYASIGLIIVGFAQAIARFVIDRVASA